MAMIPEKPQRKSAPAAGNWKVGACVLPARPREWISTTCWWAMGRARRSRGMNDYHGHDSESLIAQTIDAAQDILDPLDRLIEKSAANPGAAFETEVLEGLATLKKENRAAFESLRSKLKKSGCRVTAL